jgi:hypothetical protein
VGLEWGPLSLVSTIEELLERKNSGSCLETVGIHCADHATPSVLKTLPLTLPKSGCHSVGIVCSQTEATEFQFMVRALY